MSNENRAYTRAEVERAVNDAANLIAELHDGYESSETIEQDDTVNLVVNAAGYLLDHPDASLDEVIASVYTDVTLNEEDLDDDEEMPEKGSAGVAGVKIYTDTQADVHIGDTVRYVRWDYATRGKFYEKTGTVTELRGTGGVGIHFPHYAPGTNLVAHASDVRLVSRAESKPVRRRRLVSGPDPYDPTTDDGTVAHDGLVLPSYGD